jgi:hypothetical protein
MTNNNNNNIGKSSVNANSNTSQIQAHESNVSDVASATTNAVDGIKSIVS